MDREDQALMHQAGHIQDAVTVSALNARIATLERALAEARAKALEEAAVLIEQGQPSYNGDGSSTMRPRLEGNQDGLPYAAAIRALGSAP